MVKKYLLLGLTLLIGAGIGYTASHATRGKMVAADKMEWQSMGPDSPLKVLVLWGDPSKGEHGRLLKLPAGFVAPTHAHTGDYHGINLTGTWRHGFDEEASQDLPPGSYVFQPGKAMHNDACVGPEDCIIFLSQKVKGDFIPKEK